MNGFGRINRKCQQRPLGFSPKRGEHAVRSQRRKLDFTQITVTTPLPDVSLVPDGTTQSVCWVDGSTIVRASRDEVWDYSVSGEDKPSSVHGGVLSSDVLSRDGAPHGLSSVMTE